MDADILRLILLLFGILVVLGIYFWSRLQQGRRRPSARRREPDSQIEPPPVGDFDIGGSEAMTSDSGHLEQELDRLGEILSTEARGADDTRRGPESENASAGTSAYEQEMFDFAREEAQPATPDKAGAKLPIKILQINLVARKAVFTGPDIERAAVASGLRPGEMSIFHRCTGPAGKTVLFSMASMLEPGSFPFGAMEGFTTRGLTLFAQLPGAKEGLAVYSEMLAVAEKLAKALEGELQDQTHSALTRQTIEHTRGEIREHKRQLALAKMKS